MSMEVKEVGQIIIYLGAILFTAVKIGGNFFDGLKKIFSGKKDKDKDKSGIIVNIGSNNSGAEQASVLTQGAVTDISLYHLLLEQAQLLYALHNMRSDILRDQMEYFDKMAIDIKQKATKIMVILLKEAGIETNDYFTYFQNFENFLEILNNELSDLYRGMCKQNHFSTLDIDVFESRIKTNLSIIKGTMDNIFRTKYIQRTTIKDFEKRLRELLPEMKKAFTSCFLEARRISAKREESLALRKCVFEEKVKKATGQDYIIEVYED